MLSRRRGAAQVIIAESYGGRDEPVDALVGNFVDIGLAPPFDPLRVKGTPTEQTYQEYEEAGTDMAQLLTQKVTVAYVVQTGKSRKGIRYRGLIKEAFPRDVGLERQAGGQCV